MEPIERDPERKAPQRSVPQRPGGVPPSQTASGGERQGGGPGGSDIQRWSGSAWGKILAVGALVVGGWWYLGGSHSSITGAEQGAQYKQHQQASASMVSGLSPTDIDQQMTQQARVAVQTGQAIPDLPNPSPKLIDAIKKGDVKFYRVRAYDTCDEDGDYVTISSDSGVSYGPFMLTNAGRWLTIPVIGDKTPTVTMTGIKDGVGGITAGVETSTGIWYSKVLAPGDTEPINFSIR
jgi:hypothetical protein